MTKLTPRLLLIAACVVLAGCGGGAGKSTSTAAAPVTTVRPGADRVSTGPVRGALKAANHAPIAGKGWEYTVKVTDPAGKPMPGRVEIEFLFRGQVVGHDTPPTHRLRHGTWRSILTFSKQAIGQPLTFRALVHTGQGSITLDWPVTVTR